MSVEYTVISIGTLSHNRLWGEAGAVRTAHATTTLVQAGKKFILVDPSLPAPALEARFFERTGKRLADVTDVFCTTLRPVHRRSIEALAHANWFASELEIENYRQTLQEMIESAERFDAEDLQRAQSELKLVQRFKAAPDELAPQVGLYPLSGPSAGSAGLLLTPPTATIVIAGDAAITAEHVQRGQVWEGCHDREQALQSLSDLMELADVIIPGHDNIMFSPQRMV